MSNLAYTITLQRAGAVILSTTIPAKEAGIVGDYHEGKPYQPTSDDVRAALPFAYRAAFDRALKWWQCESGAGRALPLMCYLHNVKGKQIARLFATPNWEISDVFAK